MTDLALYRKLFVGRPDVYAVQQSDGAYFPVDEDISEVELKEHLAGMASYGTYTITPGENTVTYIVFDLDTMEQGAEVHATALSHLCECVSTLVAEPVSFVPEAGLSCVVEFSGRKGHHIWLFLDAPIPAARARQWVAAKFAPLWFSHPDVKTWNPLEVFPKQDAVPEGGYGNLVKLPFGIHAMTGNRSIIDDPELSYGFAQELGAIVPFDVGLIPDVLPTLPDQNRRDVYRPEGEGNPGPVTPFPCVTRILREGAPSGTRDKAMFHLALYLYGHGVDKDLALEMCLRANNTFDPPMKESQVRSKVDSAYRGRHESASCGTDFLKELCPGPCRNGLHAGVTAKQGELASAQEGQTVNVTVTGVEKEGSRKRLKLSHPDAANQPTLIVQGGR